MSDAEKIDSFENDASLLRVPLFADLTITTLGIEFERQANFEGFKVIAGLDEVGRGCLAGPVVAAACILDLEKPLPKGLNDSKKLTAAMRYEIAEELKADCIAYSIGQIEAAEIDHINILEATKQAMLLAIASLTTQPDYLLIDALQLKQCRLPQKAIIKGDSISASIAAASILAKTYRDDLMTAYALEYPEYGFEGHKGYGAATHLEALRIHGHCPLHRKSFRGVVQPLLALPNE